MDKKNNKITKTFRLLNYFLITKIKLKSNYKIAIELKTIKSMILGYINDTEISLVTIFVFLSQNILKSSTKLNLLGV